MSKLNINKTEWLELVFEGKNKAYGAYKLRQENNATTAKAFFGGLTLVAGLATIPFVLSSFSTKVVPKTTDPLDGPIIVCKLPPIEKPKVEPIQPSSGSVKKTAPVFRDPVVVDSRNVDPQVETPQMPNATNSTAEPTNNTGPETGVNVGTSGPGTPEPKVESPKEPVSSAILEKSPMFPGGLDAFRQQIANRFQAPEMEESSTIRVIVSFVVERDGSLTNIAVPRSAGKEIDDEAIRVLKSIKTKWTPGILNGEPVRTLYSIPIAIKSN